MELFSPITFSYVFFSRASLGLNTQTLLAVAYLIHYLNRALLSPLRSPPRSKAHIIIPIMGVWYNVMNGYLQAAFLASSVLPSRRPHSAVIIGLVLWALGFAGNIYHDEILYEIRRRANAKGKVKEGTSGSKQTYYGIPQGGLFRWISYPNYLCEWIEWAGFSWAAAPIPILSFMSCWSSLVKLTSPPLALRAFQSWKPTFPAPYAFFLSEVLLMIPRAYLGHLWYKQKFGDQYPQERWAVLPGLI
jgi:3-oxo-5-alpha-steroid 4-dehydrogenase 1